jgi:hypothetical protein
MKRDTIKTIAGLVIIGGIVVATFLYGNAQRQTQLAHDQDVKKQQDAKAQEQAKAASPSVAPATGTASSNTAPVKSPASNTIQGSTAATGTVAGAAATTPTAGGTAAPLPETGPGMVGMLGLSSIGVMALAVRRSRRAMLVAARARR